MTTPHTICPHHGKDKPCAVTCPLFSGESDAEYANRCECAAEGGGGHVVRRAVCLFDKFEDWIKEIEEAA